EKIEILGAYKTLASEYVVLGRQGQPILPISPGTTHLVPVTPDDRDPDIPSFEEHSIRRRLGLRLPPTHFPSKQ
ncbi:MAG: hypothetical protein ABSG69_19715, partial [Candidatus Acidiferrum sp.]